MNATKLLCKTTQIASTVNTEENEHKISSSSENKLITSQSSELKFL